MKKNRKVIDIVIPAFTEAKSTQTYSNERELVCYDEAGGDEAFKLEWLKNMIQIQII